MAEAETTWKPTVLSDGRGAPGLPHLFTACLTWPLLAVPDPMNPVVMRLKALDTMWNYLLMPATFTSFFVSHM